MAYHFPFGQEVRPVVQQNRTPKKVFVLGVYASAVHARWKQSGKIICQALAVASEPEIFWNGKEEKAREIISKINIPEGAGTLEPAAGKFNGPSANALDEHILAPLGYTRSDAWLCDLLPETRLNSNQLVAVDKYNKFREQNKQYGLNEVDIPKRPNIFCDQKRCEEILEELKESQAEKLVLLGDIPFRQFLRKVASVKDKSLKEYVGNGYKKYGEPFEITIGNRIIEVIPLAHPRQIGALGAHNKDWYEAHQKWKKSRLKK